MNNQTGKTTPYHALLCLDLVRGDWGIAKRFDTIIEAHEALQQMKPEEYNYMRVAIDMAEQEYLKALMVTARNKLISLFASKGFEAMPLWKYDPQRVVEINRLFSEICTLKGEPISTFQDVLTRLSTRRNEQTNGGGY